MKQRWYLFILASLLTMLTACSVMTKNQQASTAQLKKTEGIYQQTRLHKPASLLQYNHKVYLTGKPFKMQRKANLPAIFGQDITYTTAANESIKDTLSHITRMVNLPVSFEAADLAKVSASIGKKQVMIKGKLIANGQTAEAAPITTYQGSLSKILNEITNASGLFWRYKDNTIQVFSVETKVYNLDAPIGKFSLSNSITSASDLSSSGATSNQSNQTGGSNMGLNYDLQADSPWNAAIKTIKNMLSSNGRLDANPVEGYVTISDTPTKQKAIGQYITKINDKTNKKIAIRVDVYDVQATSGSNYGLDIKGIVGAFGKTVEWQSNASNLFSSSVKNSLNTLTFKRENGDDHNVVLNALSQLGKTTQVTGTTVYTISGQPAPVQNSVQQGYLKSIATSTSSGTSENTTTATLTPGTVTTGYSMTVTPRIESTNEILVSLNLQLSSLVKMDTISSNPNASDSDKTAGNTSQIQIPTVHSKNFLENMILKNGETLLIAGFQDSKVDGSTSSLADPVLWPVGGTNITDQTKTTTVVVITPYIVR